MNWTAIGVILTAISMVGTVLYFALRSLLKAELAEQRLAIMQDINGTYLRKETAESLIERADERYQFIMTQIERLPEHCPMSKAMLHTRIRPVQTQASL